MKLSTDEMRVLFENAEALLPVLSKWKHKKGGIYTIYGFGFDTERESINVHYRRIGGPNYDYQKESRIVHDRPLEEWTEDRFQRIEETEKFARPQCNC